MLIGDGFGKHETLIRILPHCFAKHFVLCRVPSHTSYKLLSCGIIALAPLKATSLDNVVRTFNRSMSGVLIGCAYVPLHNANLFSRRLMVGRGSLYRRKTPSSACFKQFSLCESVDPRQYGAQKHLDDAAVARRCSSHAGPEHIEPETTPGTIAKLRLMRDDTLINVIASLVAPLLYAIYGDEL